MAQRLAQWTPFGNHRIVFVLSHATGYGTVKGGRGGGAEVTLIGALLIPFFFTLLSNALEPSETPLKRLS